MAMLQSSPPISEADYRRLLEEPGVEYAGDRIVEKPMSREVAKVEVRIIRLLAEEADRAPGIAEVFNQSLAYRCYPDDSRKFRKPDVSVIRADRLGGIPLDAGYSPIPADLVIEVISPNDIAEDVAEKVEEYLANGFKLVWVVQPRTR